MPANKRDLQALHYLAQRLRAETYGAGKWDDNGLTAILTRLEGQQLASVVERVTRNAADREARTPGAIERPFTPGPASEREPWQPERGPWCGICGVSRDRHITRSDHLYEPPADRKRAPDAIRAIVEEAKGRKEPTRVAVEEPAAPQHDPRADVAREALHTPDDRANEEDAR